MALNFGLNLRWDYEIYRMDHEGLWKWFVYFDSFSDKKLVEWPMMSSPLYPLLVLCCYFLCVFYGFRILDSSNDKSSSPFRIVNYRLFKLILVAYNLSISGLNAWIAYELIANGLSRNYNFLCELVYPHTDNEFENRIARAIWWYWASKGIELLDTLFIIAKAKRRQLTFLHVYHHSSMFAVWWVGAKFVPGGSALSGSCVNCLVHVVMYAYYALSSIGYRQSSIINWLLACKQQLTILQMIQFMIGVVLGINSIVTGCAFTRWMQYVFVAYAGSFLLLFSKFYARTYALEWSKNRSKQSKNSHKKSE